MSSQHHTHRLESSAERVEYQTQFLKWDNAQQRFITWLSKNHGRVGVALGKRHETLRNAALNYGTVVEPKILLSFRFQANFLPGEAWEERVGCATINEEVHVFLDPRGATGRAVNVGNTRQSSFSRYWRSPVSAASRPRATNTRLTIKRTMSSTLRGFR